MIGINRAYKSPGDPIADHYDKRSSTKCIPVDLIVDLLGKQHCDHTMILLPFRGYRSYRSHGAEGCKCQQNIANDFHSRLGPRSEVQGPSHDVLTDVGGLYLSCFHHIHACDLHPFSLRCCLSQFSINQAIHRLINDHCQPVNQSTFWVRLGTTTQRRCISSTSPMSTIDRRFCARCESRLLTFSRHALHRVSARTCL